MSSRLSFAITAALCGLLTSCAGYRLGPVKSDRMKDISTVAVPVFKNLTLEPRSATLITDEVTKRLQNDGTFRIRSVTDADAVIKGTIRDIRRRPLRSARFNTLRTREMEITLIVEFSIVDGKTNAVLADGMAQGSSNIFLDQNFQLSERQALQEAAQDVASDIVSRVAEGIPGQSGISGRGRMLGDNSNLSGF